MGQRKDFGMPFCQGKIPILSLQTPSDLRESLVATITTLENADELELEVTDLREGADGVVAFVRAWGVDREECLLDVMNQVRQAGHRGACCGAARAMAFVQFRSGYKLGNGDLWGTQLLAP